MGRKRNAINRREKAKRKNDLYTPHLLEKNHRKSSIWEFSINWTVFWILAKWQSRSKKTIGRYFSEKFATFELDKEKYMYWLTQWTRMIILWSKEEVENVLNKS